MTAFFETHSAEWDDLYTQDGLRAEVFRARQARVLEWIDALPLARGSRVLDVGSGAGHMTVALAERGFEVVAIDPSESMRERTRLRVEQSGQAGNVTFQDADVQALPFIDEEFDLVVALGILPWVPSPELAIQEMSRVLQPDGHIVVTADNSWRLTFVVDPLLTPAYTWPRRKLMGLFADRKQHPATHESDSCAIQTNHNIPFINRLLRSTLTNVRTATIGFGPFTLFGRTAFADDRGLAVHRRLQTLADRGSPLFRFAGTHYLVLARKRRRARTGSESREGALR